MCMPSRNQMYLKKSRTNFFSPFLWARYFKSLLKKVVFSGLFIGSLSVTFEINAEVLSWSPKLGKPAKKILIDAWNQDIFPDGQGLPDGSGNAKTGKELYQKYCVSCHGVKGRGLSADELAGAEHGLTDDPPDKTIGTYWPYATTLFDFIRRSMPMDRPGILSDNEIYSISAYLLYLNDIIKEDDQIDAKSLARIAMPNKNGFINVYRLEQRK